MHLGCPSELLPSKRKDVSRNPGAINVLQVALGHKSFQRFSATRSAWSSDLSPMTQVLQQSPLKLIAALDFGRDVIIVALPLTTARRR